MKSMLIDLIKKNSSFWILIICINLIFWGMYKYYKPLCEPCLPNSDCPPCLSDEQYFIIYFAPILNLILVGVHYYLKSKQKPSH